MPIFARRQLRSMLDELSIHLDAAKTNELLNRLEHIDTNTALAAEAELSMIWAISRVAHLSTEPVLANSSRRPDALSDNLFASSSAIIEIRALSDDRFSGKEAMDRTANIINGFTNELRKGAGRHLHFEFLERSYWDKRFHRERCVDPSFELTLNVRRLLREWITASNWPTPQHIRITEGKTDVVISWHKATSRFFRVFCSMPPVAYDLEDNPIYKALKKKSGQISGAPPNMLRCVFLVDAGCHLLWQSRHMTAGTEVGGEAIIRHALKKLSIDVVCVFSPQRERQFGLVPQSRMHWKVACIDKRNSVPIGEYDRLKELAENLPLPRFEGYQARDLHRQGIFDPRNPGRYLTTTINIDQAGTKMTIKISSRLILEYLAGRMDIATFQRDAFQNNENYFDVGLTRGHTIQDIRFESGGINKDDDYLIFNLDFDWGASVLRRAQEPPKSGKT